MTSLLTHTVTHSIRPSFRLKTNNQPLKKFLSLAVSWQNSDFQSQFSMSKITRIFLIFFSLENTILGAHFLLLTFFENFHF